MEDTKYDHLPSYIRVMISDVNLENTPTEELEYSCETKFSGLMWVSFSFSVFFRPLLHTACANATTLHDTYCWDKRAFPQTSLLHYLG